MTVALASFPTPKEETGIRAPERTDRVASSIACISTLLRGIESPFLAQSRGCGSEVSLIIMSLNDSLSERDARATACGEATPGKRMEQARCTGSANHF